MPIEEGDETLTFTKRDRCTRVELYIDSDSGSGRLVFYRERVFVLGGVIQHRKPLPTIERTLAQIAAQQFAINGQLTLTGQQFMTIVNKVADILRQDDINAG